MSNDKYSNGEYQRAVSDLVSREVIHLASSMVYELTQKQECLEDYEEEIFALWSSEPDYETAIYDEVRNWDRDQCVEQLESLSIHCDDDESIATLREAVMANADGDDEFCEIHGIDLDDYRREIFEHWIVSAWLADKLEEKGETVVRGFLGFTIWGRGTTGQAICLDRVICDIYDDLMETKDNV